MEALVENVARSAVVLVFLSNRLKNSAACRSGMTSYIYGITVEQLLLYWCWAVLRCNRSVVTIIGSTGVVMLMTTFACQFCNSTVKHTQ